MAKIDYSQLTKIPAAEDYPTLPIEVAGRLAYGVARASSYNLAKSGGLPTIRLSAGRTVVPTAALRAMLGLDQ